MQKGIIKIRKTIKIIKILCHIKYKSESQSNYKSALINLLFPIFRQETIKLSLFIIFGNVLNKLIK